MSKYTPTPQEDINRYQRLILIHSCLYYRMNTSIVSDHVFDQWCVKLVGLMKKHPNIKGPWHEAFEDFNGSTGYHLPYADPYVVSKAFYVLDLHKRRG